MRNPRPRLSLISLAILFAITLVSAAAESEPAWPPVAAAPAQPPPQVAGCTVFPADNIWNATVDGLPVHAISDAYIATIGADTGLHPDFGSGLWEGGPIGIPYVDVPGDQARVPVSFTYDDESDPGPYPIPPDAPIEGGAESDGDRHVLVLDRDNCVLYEIFYAFRQADGSWEADSGAIFDLKSHALRPETWTSADAAGLPILPGLVRYDEVAGGEIRHALRFTAPQTRRAYTWPGRHFASTLTGPQYPPMGQRFRLNADFDVSGFSPQVQVILRALKKYGMMLADNGSAWFVSGAPDERWDNDVLRELRQVRGADFEAVDVSSLMVDADSGRVRTGSRALYLPLIARVPQAPAPTATPTAQAGATVTPTHAATTIAADLFVDDDNSTGVEDGSARYPYNIVQEAIAAAANGQVIAVAAGAYAQNVRVQNKTVHLYGGFAGGSAADYASGASGNFSSTNPLFADAANHDYHLRSTAGRWSPAANGGGAWVPDAQHSPAIDAGDPASPFAAEPAPNGGRANMGAYGNIAQASKSAAAMD